ncbi:MAG TPA: M48 family metallopeptidase [Pyrinomonadaceae bacterium]|jgi:Zn-dependent protease with chaperone function|nr:M48 family metallopeptidase [Pyrinomonadaceae bacterium]
MRTAILLAGFCLILSAGADTRQPAAPSPQTEPAAQSDAPSASESGPVAVPEPSEKAQSYHRGGNVIWAVGVVWGLLVPALFLFTGLSARIRDWARRLGRKWFFVVGIYFVIFSLVNFVVSLPLAYYVGFVREHAYGLSNQTFDKWLGDSLKALMVDLVVGFLFLWVPYMLLRKSPRRWWLYTGLLTVPFLFALILVVPIWVEPLFNKFGPMKDKALEAKILSLAERAGIEGGRVYEVEKREDTETVNAYVTGFAGTKRIVFWDTTLAKMSERELLFVMGHEMGHYVLGHVWQTILFFSAVIMATLYAIHRTAGWLVGRYRHRFGFDHLSDIASLPLIILLFGAYFFLVTPFVLAYTRHVEHESDRFGLEITRDNRAGATAFIKLQTENLAVPRPGLLYKLWRESHPPLGERIDFCNDYRPWERGEPRKYEHLFKGMEHR